MFFNWLGFLLVLLNWAPTHSSNDSEMTTALEEISDSTVSPLDDYGCQQFVWNISCSVNGEMHNTAYKCNISYKCPSNFNQDQNSDNHQKLATYLGDYGLGKLTGVYFFCEREPNYCGKGWRSFWSNYDSIHDAVKLLLCVIGCLTNVVNLTVLTRRNMISPLNMLLTALSASDFLFMLDIVIDNALQIYVGHFGDYRTSYQESVEKLIGVIFHNLFRMLSVYFTVLVAVWRFVGIVQPLRSRRFLTENCSKWAIGLTFLGCSLFVAIRFKDHRIKEKTDKTFEENLTNAALLQDPEYEICASQNNFATFFPTALVLKLVPCGLLTILTLAILWSLMKAKRTRNHLVEPNLEVHNAQSFPSRLPTRKKDKTNKMLLLILIMFLVTESPIGIYLIVVPIVSGVFFKQCLRPPSRFLYLLECLSCVSSLFIYVSISTAFRSTLIKTLNKIAGVFQWPDKRLQSSLPSTELSNIPNSSSL